VETDADQRDQAAGTPKRGRAGSVRVRDVAVKLFVARGPQATQPLDIEPLWVSWKLGGLDPDVFGITVLGSVIRLLVFAGGKIAEVAVQAAGVVPEDPAESR